MEAEVGLVAGRSQREKRRSYKDLLREEEIIDAEVRKTSKKQIKDSELILPVAETQKKRNHHHLYQEEQDPLFRESQKRKRCSSFSSPQTAMGLLEAISCAESSSTSSSFSPHRQRSAQYPSWGSDRKRPSLVRKGLPVVGEELELEDNLGGAGDSSGLSSVGESEKPLILDSSHNSSGCGKRKKRSKKSKKKQRERVGPAGTESSGHHLNREEKKKRKKKREDGSKHKSKEKKRKFLTAYQIFYKEYRSSILEEEPGLDFGELSKRLAEAWKQLPEGDKQVWRERSEYLQRKQMKSESIRHRKHTKPAPQRQAQQQPQGSKDTGIRVKVCVSPDAALKSQELPAAIFERTPLTSNRRPPELDPIDAAAHLQLLGESLSVIGRRLQETEGMVTVSGSLSVLLDSLVCVFSSLSCLTTLVPELNGCPRLMLSSTLDNIAYVMPGL